VGTQCDSACVEGRQEVAGGRGKGCVWADPCRDAVRPSHDDDHYCRRLPSVSSIDQRSPDITHATVLNRRREVPFGLAERLNQEVIR